MNDKLRDEILLRLWQQPPKSQAKFKRDRIAAGGKISHKAKPKNWFTKKEKELAEKRRQRAIVAKFIP